ncbi:DUF6338 family protein [Stenotrophobium rhamnosiphilum]|nr:DUF6338 family protein [Stenotrophobium rhamnosiphilum]
MAEGLSKDFLELLTYLLPGFMSAWVFYGLTSHPKPSQFERVAQALIFTFIIRTLVPLCKWALELAGNCIAIAPWSRAAEAGTALVLALAFGAFLAYCTNTDSIHERLREAGLTARTSHPSEWFYVLSKKITFVILHMTDGRRLYGWPKEWPIEADKGQFYIMLPAWIQEDGTQVDLPQLDGILVSVKDVKWVEFLQKAD